MNLLFQPLEKTVRGSILLKFVRAVAERHVPNLQKKGVEIGTLRRKPFFEDGGPFKHGVFDGLRGQQDPFPERPRGILHALFRAAHEIVCLQKGFQAQPFRGLVGETSQISLIVDCLIVQQGPVFPDHRSGRTVIAVGELADQCIGIHFRVPHQLAEKPGAEGDEVSGDATGIPVTLRQNAFGTAPGEKLDIG
ncbi:MAG: hypothetical protein BWY31_04474 [Lentisphaerae bacterium ADurb.Bin242]|nr:MAG: hypothetical protein BWY31_04474 [Lentisphaerae bacterium ADurb.Bin242]